jgi:Transposase and inactivated derivatives
MKYIGLDIHKRNTFACIVNASGKEVHTMEVRSRPDGLETIVEYMEDEDYAVLMESSTYALQVHRFFCDHGIETYTAHAKYLAMITKSDRKTDKIDASHLARYLRLWKNGELPLSMSHIPDERAQALRDLCRFREDITKELSDDVRKMRSHLASKGSQFGGNLKTKKARAFLRYTYPDDIVLANRLDMYESLLKKADDIDNELDIFGKNDDNVRLLMTIPGVGMRSAVQIMSMIMDVTRFTDQEKLCAYFGLAPRVRDSGGKSNHGHMTKNGDPMMRAVLDRVTYVHICSCDSSITEFYNRKSKENKKKALTSASRKMLCMMYAILSRGTGFAA